MSKNKYLSIGKILGSRGIKGELKVQAWTDTLEDFCSISKIFLNINESPLDIVNLRVHKSCVLMKVGSIENKDQAEMLRGKILYAYKDDIPIEDDRYFIEDLKGCEIIDSNDGRVYGILKDVINTGANDIYIVKNSEKCSEYLVPIIDGTISEINLEENKIYLSPIKGVFDDNWYYDSFPWNV